MSEYILAIDLGTSGCKAALVDIKGVVHAWEFQAVKMILPPGGGSEQDPVDWWNAIKAASKALLDNSSISPADVIAVCANTQGEGTVPVDEAGHHLCNGILWMDARGEPHVKALMKGWPNVSGYGLLKVLQYIRLTGGAPSLTGRDATGHMLLLKEEMPEIFQNTYKFLNVLDYINLKLTGNFVATYDSVFTTWVTDNRDPHNIYYHPGLCAHVGVPMEKFPDIVPCTEIVGELVPEFAQATGIPAGIPVIAGSIDTAAAAVGAGTVKDGDVHYYMGTSGWLGAHVPAKKTDINSAIASMPCAIPGKYLMIALQTSAGGNLAWLKDQVLYHQDELLQEDHAPDIYKVLDHIVENTPAGANGVIYTPWLYGERAPIEDYSIRGGLNNISLHNSRKDIIKAVYEGTALNTRWIVKPVEKFIGQRINSIAMVGGGAQSDQWCQIFADVLDRPIRQIAGAIEANIRGSAYMAAVGLGKITFEEAGEFVQTKHTYHPQSENRKVYDIHFREFKNLYKAHRKICRRLGTFHNADD